MGMALYNGDVLKLEHSFSLMECFEHSKKGENIKFTDDNISRELDIPLLLPFSGMFTLLLNYLSQRVGLMCPCLHVAKSSQMARSFLM